MVYTPNQSGWYCINHVNIDDRGFRKCQKDHISEIDTGCLLISNKKIGAEIKTMSDAG